MLKIDKKIPYNHYGGSISFIVHCEENSKVIIFHYKYFYKAVHMFRKYDIVCIFLIAVEC